MVTTRSINETKSTMTLYIDNIPYEVKPGKNLLETCLSLGFDLPYFCWHPALGSVGACRQCAVRGYKDENDNKGRLIMACMEPVMNNQRISIQDPDAREFRENIIEWLMTNHPHDCAVCDEGGSCHLQDMTVMTGHDYRRYRFKKRTHINQYLGPFINHEMNRCIQCYRCVRFYKDYAGGNDLDAFASRSNVYFGRHEDGVLENEFSGNLTEVCPTGVFTDKTLKQHYTRKWDLTTAPSICHHCSLGCNIIAGERYGKLRSITSRYNGEVNGYFICDRGRFGYEFVNSPDRVTKPTAIRQPANSAETLHAAAQLLNNSRVIGIGSPRASVQSNFALKTLVGKDNFYHGVSHNEHDLADLVVKILRDGPVRSFSMKEVESADTVFVLGEDLTNSAPMLALAVRQSVRQRPISEHLVNVKIPEWHDGAVRELVQDEKGPLFIASVHRTKLDDVATETFHSSPDEIARLGFAVAHILDSDSVEEELLPLETEQLAQRIARILTEAKRPVIISGASCETDHVIEAAANIAWALHKKNANTGIVLTLPECNSLGLGMIGGFRLEAAFNAVLNGHADTVIVMENDLYRHGKKSDVDKFLNACKNVIVLDHTPNQTTEKASVLLPAATFAESDGTLVNNEGRMQRFFQVYEPEETIRESWRWLLDIGTASGNNRMAQWQTFEDLTHAIATEEQLLKDIDQVSPPHEFRVNGQRIPRQPHRFSGRTAIQANLNVSEPKPPVDQDSSLSYTMEGYSGLPPSSMIPFYWAPGWNSVQSLNKYQQEVGGPLRGGDPGIRCFDGVQNKKVEYFISDPSIYHLQTDHLMMVPLHHIFGSEELSARAPSVAERCPEPYVMLNNDDATALHIQENELLSFQVDGQPYKLPARLSSSMIRGMAGLPYGLKGLPFVELPEWAILKKD
jgi:NADH-quinone oxidoreductase subunit G